MLHMSKQLSAESAIMLVIIWPEFVFHLFSSVVSSLHVIPCLTFTVDADITLINSKNSTGIGKIKLGHGKAIRF